MNGLEAAGCEPEGQGESEQYRARRPVGAALVVLSSELISDGLKRQFWLH